MENNNALIIEELKASVARLREELGGIEARLSELVFDEPTCEDEIPAAEEEVLIEEEQKPEAFDISLDDIPQQAPEIQGSPLVPEFEKPVEAVFEQAAEDAPRVFYESVMPDTLAWKRDVPGSPVQNILSAISLNDRVQFINVLFSGDPLLFQETVRAFNGFSSLAEAENYISATFPKWKLESDVVYRFMMAVRRKLN